METHQPDVVVTYDDYGLYGHPDHIQTHRVVHAALEKWGDPVKLYYTAIPRSRLRTFGEILDDAGIERPRDVEEDPNFGTPDDLITTTIDVTAFAGQKFASLGAHASQSENIFFLQMGEELFARVMGTESFVRVIDHTEAPVPEEDLFAGLR
jgi:LmbE family N-acetylglucosaminyl deacetylase